MKNGDENEKPVQDSASPASRQVLEPREYKLHCYLHKGLLLCPTVVDLPEGFFGFIEPVAAVPLDDPKIAEELTTIFLRPIPMLPYHLRPRLDPLYKDCTPNLIPILKRAGLRTFRAFDRTAKHWYLKTRDEKFLIYRFLKNWRYRRVLEKADVERLPIETNLDDVIAHFITCIRNDSLSKEARHQE